jgi:hypothetical protein
MYKPGARSDTIDGPEASTSGWRVALPWLAKEGDGVVGSQVGVHRVGGADRDHTIGSTPSRASKAVTIGPPRPSLTTALHGQDDH